MPIFSYFNFFFVFQLFLYFNFFVFHIAREERGVCGVHEVGGGVGYLREGVSASWVSVTLVYSGTNILIRTQPVCIW